MHCADIIIIELCIWCKCQAMSRIIRKHHGNVSKLLFVRSMSVNVRDSMSEDGCQRPNVRDSMSETQCQRLNVRDSTSESDLLTWSLVLATPHTLVYNLILVYEGIVNLLCLVFHPWTAAISSVNANRLLTISMSWKVLASVQNSGVSSRSGSDPEQNRCNVSYHMKTGTVAIGPVLPPKTRHFNITSLSPIKYLSSDGIMTQLICKLCSFMRSFTSRFQICDRTNIR